MVYFPQNNYFPVIMAGQKEGILLTFPLVKVRT